MKIERETWDWLEWRADAKKQLDEYAYEGWVLVTPIHTPCGGAHFSQCIRATVPSLVHFLAKFSEAFGFDYTMDLEKPRWPIEYAVVWNHPDHPEGVIMWPHGGTPPLDKKQMH